jgi:hypothetical protein
MQNLTSVVRSLTAYGPDQLMEEMKVVWEEIEGFSQQLCGELEELLPYVPYLTNYECLLPAWQ